MVATDPSPATNQVLIPIVASLGGAIVLLLAAIFLALCLTACAHSKKKRRREEEVEVSHSSRRVCVVERAANTMACMSHANPVTVLLI